MDSKLSSAREALALDIVQQLGNSGYRAYLVGGCVRDRLLGIAPKDFDISTDALPEEIIRHFPQSQRVGAHFGVILVRRQSGVHVEVATFRSEGVYADGRRPDEVRFVTDPSIDVQRRDFTINGLMEDPFTGQIFDFVGGQADLSTRVVRAIGNPDLRFHEDHLRMLRAVRFAARLRFSIEPATLAAIRQQAQCICRISAERIRDELNRILTEGGARFGFELLDTSRLLQYVLPDVKAFQGVAQPPEFHPEGDVWTHILSMLGEMQCPSVTLAFGVLLHDVGKPPTFRVADRIRFDGHAELGADMAKSILLRLKLPTADIERVTSLVANHMRFKDVRQMRISTLKRFVSLPHFSEHLELHRLDCLASNGKTDTYDYVRSKLAEMNTVDLHPKPLLTGHDLIRAGFRPGPAFGRALEAVITGQLEGVVLTREQAVDVARSVLEDARVTSTLHKRK